MSLLLALPRDIALQVVRPLLGYTTDQVVQLMLKELRFLYGDMDCGEIRTNHCLQYVEERVARQMPRSVSVGVQALAWRRLLVESQYVSSYIFYTPPINDPDQATETADDEFTRHYAEYSAFLVSFTASRAVELGWISLIEASAIPSRWPITAYIRATSLYSLWVRWTNRPVSYAAYLGMMRLLGLERDKVDGELFYSSREHPLELMMWEGA